MFVLLEDGISYVRDSNSVGNDPGGAACAISVRPQHERHVIDAAEDCPGECMFVEPDLDTSQHDAEIFEAQLVD